MRESTYYGYAIAVAFLALGLVALHQALTSPAESKALNGMVSGPLCIDPRPVISDKAIRMFAPVMTSAGGQEARKLIKKINQTGSVSNWRGDFIVGWYTLSGERMQFLIMDKGCMSVVCNAFTGCFVPDQVGEPSQ